jgi:hypothetical protein
MIALRQNAPLFIRKAVKAQRTTVAIAINPKTKDIYLCNATTINGRAAIRYESTGQKQKESGASNEA